jgi:hypothetical protein
MQRHGKHCMQKVHRRYKYTVQRRDKVVVAVGIFGLLLEVVVVIQVGRRIRGQQLI